MPSLPTREQIKPGLRVKIESKQNMGTGNLTEGIVKEILTSATSHPYGIMVALENGDIGRVKQCLDDVVSNQIFDIPSVEDTWNEFKSTFQYDLEEEKLRKNDRIEAAEARKSNYKKIREYIQKEVSITIAAFANKEGGKLFVGVNDDSSVLGLGRDLKAYSDSLDKLTLAITDSLKKFLKNNAFISKLKFEYGISKDEKQYLKIIVPPSNEPIFVHDSNGQEAYVRMHKSSEKFSYEDFLKHCKERFPNH